MTDDEFVKKFCHKCINRKGFEEFQELFDQCLIK